MTVPHALAPLLAGWLRDFEVTSRLDVSAATDLTNATKHDLVVAVGSLGEGDWRPRVHTLAQLSGKALVVVVPNADHWGTRLRGVLGRRTPESSLTRMLAPELWKLGRVRDHVYLDGSRRTARLHAFLVDLRPRTPQQRRRLAVAPNNAASSEEPTTQR